MKRQPMLRCVASMAAAVLLAAAPPAGAQAPGAVKVRPIYEQGRRLRYQLTLSGATAWAPTVQGVTWGKMKTDFTFVLATKVLRTTGLQKGCCTFRLLGEHLRSEGSGANGAFGGDATRDRTRVKVKDRWQVTVQDRSPLRKDMTLTLGPLGGFRFGTRLGGLVLYMLPHVDHRFWTLLTIAPNRDVAPGDHWEQAFEFPVPGSTGKPLKLTGKWQEAGWERYRGRSVLALTLAAELDLKDANVMLKNGDLVHVTSGTYKAEGKAKWDVAGGVLCHATASQKVLIKADQPGRRALRSECESTLQLLAARKAQTGAK